MEFLLTFYIIYAICDNLSSWMLLLCLEILRLCAFL